MNVAEGIKQGVDYDDPGMILRVVVSLERDGFNADQIFTFAQTVRPSLTRAIWDNLVQRGNTLAQARRRNLGGN